MAVWAETEINVEISSLTSELRKVISEIEKNDSLDAKGVRELLHPYVNENGRIKDICDKMTGNSNASKSWVRMSLQVALLEEVSKLIVIQGNLLVMHAKEGLARC